MALVKILINWVSVSIKQFLPIYRLECVYFSILETLPNRAHRNFVKFMVSAAVLNLKAFMNLCNVVSYALEFSLGVNHLHHF